MNTTYRNMIQGNLLLVAAVFAGSLVALPARAEGSGPSSAILAYGKVGSSIPVNNLSPHVAVRVGAGYLLPVLKRRLAAVIDLGYAQNTTKATISDPRLGESGASFSYTMIQRDLNLFIGPQVYFLDPYRRFVPYAAVGVDLHFLRSAVEGEGNGQVLGGNDEVSTKAGFALRGGVGYRLGPGLVTGELTFSWAPIDHDITGESHLGQLAVLLGYTVMFGF